MSELCTLSAIDLLGHFRARRLSPVEVAREVIGRAEAIQPKTNAFCWLDPDGAMTQARKAEAAWMGGGEIGALEGVPVSIKDVVAIGGRVLGRGSRMSDHSQPAEFDAPSVARLRKAGAVLFGCTTTSEGGWKAVTDSPRTGVTRNPYDLSKTPGGSSGGGAVAVACGAGPITLGSDGGGSIRIPASFVGLVGVKPQYGRVPQSLLGAHYGNLAHLGPMARSVADAALALRAMSGDDPVDPDALPNPPFDETDLEASLVGRTIGLTKDFGFHDVDPEIRGALDELRNVLANAGARIVSIPDFDDWRPAYRTLWQAGAYQAQRRLAPHMRDLIEPGLREVAARGSAVSTDDYLDAVAFRTALRQKMSMIHAKVDFVVSPTVATLPFAAGVDVPNGSFADWLDWAGLSFAYNLTGQPVASFPIGMSSTGMPIGAQVAGAAYKDQDVLRIAQAISGLTAGRCPQPALPI